jgi:hypothetical protein
MGLQVTGLERSSRCGWFWLGLLGARRLFGQIKFLTCGVPAAAVNAGSPVGFVALG